MLDRTLSLALVLGLSLAPAARGAAPPDEDGRIVQALSRLTYGPRPGDVERVRTLGVLKWIDLQVHPDRIRENPEVLAALAPLRTVSMSSAELMKGYELPPQAKQELQRRQATLGDNATDADTAKVRQEIMAKYKGDMEGPPHQIVDDLQAAKIIRAVSSERQLNEVLVDFWMNHFNVYADKGQDKYLITEYEREVVRPRAWGRFEELLLATARSPAMLFYLDNWLSADPNAPDPARFAARRRPGPGRPDPRRQNGAAPRPKQGLNENYAREIMELHTLGVDGGYTQKDVTELARVLTGWTIRGIQKETPEFFFDSRIHDPRDKLILGQVIQGSGEDEGRRMIHLLATHPATAHFVCLKLARRFVSDDPPKALVDRTAATFLNTGGDVRAVVMTLVTSPEFFAPEARGAKIKTPLEFVVSALRAAGAAVEDGREPAKRIASMGMPLYLQQPPTGYKDTADAWVSTGGLLARLNFALDLAGGRLKGIRVDPAILAPHAGDGEGLAEALATQFVPSGLGESTRKIVDAEAGTGLNAPRIAGLILGSPEFQRK